MLLTDFFCELSEYEIEVGPNGLLAPVSYWELTPQQRRDLYNGAGTEDINVPDNLFGVVVTEPSRIHDHMFEWSDTREKKQLSDFVYLINMQAMVIYRDCYAGWKEKRLFLPRMDAVQLYHFGVHRWGHCPNAGLIPWWKRWLIKLTAIRRWFI